jgi:hypothetical protein
VAHEMIARPLFEEDVAHLTARAANGLGVVVNSKEWPVLDVTIEHATPLRLRFTCDNWEEQPPAISCSMLMAPFSRGTCPVVFSIPVDSFACVACVNITNIPATSPTGGKTTAAKMV